MAHTQRFSMLVDADAYFSAVRAAMRTARHSIFILSWDIDSRTCLVPGGAQDGYPEPLADFLHALLDERPGLHIYVLNWDFAVLYALEREWLQSYKLAWRSSDNFSFCMDGRHPISASHHQKIVVVDDAVAFVGGLDMTEYRWDTPEHAARHPLRKDLSNKPYGPFHDVQALVDGNAAQALGELVRERWKRASSRVPVPLCTSPGHDPWPDNVRPDLTDIDVGIARTEPSHEGRAGIYEIRQLHLDIIAGARHALFFENQYFTSGLIANALAQRLQEAAGPEVMVISPQTQSGWLEDATMGVLRARMQNRLQQADVHDRYHLYAPYLPDLENGCLNVHSKVFAMDDDVFSIGSANLSNRSMVLDTECNVVIEASGTPEEKQRIRAGIARMRNRLLAEHLATSVHQVSVAVEQTESLHAAIKALHTPGRSLRIYHPTTTPELEALIPENALFDPERPIDPNKLMAQLVPKDARKPLPRRFLGLSFLTLALILLAVAWRWTPMREWMNLTSMVALVRSVEAMPFTPLIVLGGYVIAGFLMVPVTLLIAVTGIVFGPYLGAAYAMAGSLLSAWISYWVGYWLGRDVVRRLLGTHVHKLGRRIARQGIVAMVILRLLPISPFTIVNIVAGAANIRLRDYLIGTVLGMGPGIVLTVLFIHNLVRAIRNPSLGTVAILVLVSVSMIAFSFLLQRLFSRRQKGKLP